MNIVELYEKAPVERHHEIIVAGDRLFYDGDEYLIDSAGELRLLHSHKGLAERLKRLEQQLSSLRIALKA